MADITITVGPSLAAWLANEVQDHNARHGTNLNIPAWLVLFLRERAIAEALPAEIEVLQRAYDRDLQAAIRAKKQELMGGF